jgi:hypothetical protein
MYNGFIVPPKGYPKYNTGYLECTNIMELKDLIIKFLKAQEVTKSPGIPLVFETRDRIIG